MKKNLFLIMLISSLSHGQCEDYDKLEIGGTYLANTNNYIPFEIKYKDSIYREDVFYPFDIKIIEKYSGPILLKAETYIKNRAGENFFKNLELESMEVNYPKNIKVTYENHELYEIENYDVKYWIKYKYTKDDYKFAFCLLFDKEGKLLSENKFPDLTKNPNFENYIDPCEALKLVKRKFRRKKIDFIELAYVDEINSFCWLVKEKKLPTKLGINNYKLDSYFVNANSIKLEKVTVENCISIACGFSTKKIKSKK